MKSGIRNPKFLPISGFAHPMSFWSEVRRIGGRSDRILKRCYRSLRSLQHDNNRVAFTIFLLFTFYFLPACAGRLFTFPSVSAQTIDPVKSQIMDELNRASTDDFVPDEILVKFRPYILESQSYDDTNDVLTTTGVPYKEKQKLFAKSMDEAPELFNIYEVQVLAGTDIKRAVIKLNNKMDVVYAEPNYKAYAFFTPNDPSFSQQYGLQNIQAPQAWDIHQGDAAAVAAVVDTGINSSHADLTNKVTNGSYDCGIYHGTHCAGIIAADTNNGVGVAGVGFKVNLAGYNALGCSGSGDFGTIAQRINNATNDGVKVINLSLGGTPNSTTLKNAIDNAVNSGVVVVASAGNCGEGCPSSRCQSINEIDYPAAYDNVIAVAATDSSDQRACFSTKNDYVNVTAPGVNIYSTLGSSYGNMSGTSMSGPHVAGLAALLYSLPQYATRSSANAQAVRQIIESTTDDLGPSGKDPEYGTGRINAYRALQAATGGTPPATPTPTPVNTPTPTLTPTLTPTSTPTPIVTATPTPTTSITPTITLTPSPTATPTPGPSPTPTSTPTAGPSPTPRPTPTFCGPNVDVNQDGIVDKKDLDTILVNYTNIHTLTLVGDINNDGQVNSIDASMVIACWGWRGP